MKSLPRIDREVLWHPFTQQSEWEKEISQVPLVIRRGRGNYLFDQRGGKYLDGVSSLWANLHGHRRPELDRALRAQLGRVAHSTFLGLSHEPGIRLAEELVRAAPGKLARVFYSDNGSTAVEVALKMAFQHQAQRRRGGSAKTEFLALKNSYHGDTLGSVSVGGIDLFHKKFRPLLFKAHFALSPHCLRCPHRKKEAPRMEYYEYRGERPKPGDARPRTGCRWECLGSVQSILRRRRGRIAAAVFEPVVQGASGILSEPPGYAWGFVDLCRRAGVPVVMDEVAVGFGRTGRLFACEHEKAYPDLICLAKGISGGYLPLAATLASQEIYRSFLGKYEDFKTFFHGHTYTANPLACATGLASLKIFRTKKVLERTRELAPFLRGELEKMAGLPWVGQVRQAGLIAGIELLRDRKTVEAFPPRLRLGKKVCLEARRYGLLLRPLGDVIVLMPPLSVNRREIRMMTDGVAAAIRTVARREGLHVR